MTDDLSHMQEYQSVLSHQICLEMLYIIKEYSACYSSRICVVLFPMHRKKSIKRMSYGREYTTTCLYFLCTI